MFILWIILGVLIGLAIGFWTRTSRDEAIHDSWRARLVQAENTIDELRSGSGARERNFGQEEKGLSLLREQLLKCESERSAALAENDGLKSHIAELQIGMTHQLKTPSPVKSPPPPKNSTKKSGQQDLPENAAARAAATGIPAASLSDRTDDLKTINGIGPKMEALLHDLGVFTFAQVSAWSDDHVTLVDARLEGFKGRIERDNWVEQAKSLT